MKWTAVVAMATSVAVLASCASTPDGGSLTQSALLVGDMQVEVNPPSPGPSPRISIPEISAVDSPASEEADPTQAWPGLSEEINGRVFDRPGTVLLTNSEGTFPSVLVRGISKKVPVVFSVIWDTARRRPLAAQEVITPERLDDVVGHLADALRQSGMQADFSSLPAARRWDLFSAIAPTSRGGLQVYLDGCRQGDCTQPLRRVTLASNLVAPMLTDNGRAWLESGKLGVRIPTPPKAVEPPPEPAGEPDCSKLKCVALTFDDGPGPYTEQLLNILKRSRAKATFFLIGKSIQARVPLVKRMLEEGHEVGNHSWNHVQMTKQTAAVARAELDNTSAELEKVTGVKPTLYRPPFGAHATGIDTRGMPVIMWNVDTLDWKHKDPAQSLAAVQKSTKPGSVILMHDIHQQSVAAVPSIISFLRSQGYTLVTTHQLLGKLNPAQIYHGRNG